MTGAAIRFVRSGHRRRPARRGPRPATAACTRRTPTTGASTTAPRRGILGPVVGLVGCVQATETIKLIAGIGESLAGRLVLYDALGMEWNEIRLARRPDCPVCLTRD